MAETTLVARNFDRGVRRDRARDQLERGDAYDLVDYLIQVGAPARKRGPWAYASVDLNGLSSAARLVAAGWAPFSTDGHLVMVADNGKLYRTSGAINSSSGVLVSTASTVAPTYRPFWHRDRMIVLPGLDQGTLTPRKYYDAGGGAYTYADITGSPPSARVGASWGDYLLLANTPAARNTIYISGVGNPDSWATSTSFFAVRDEIVGIIPLRTLILVFQYDKIEYITGDTPPPGGNWARKDLFATGCMDGRTIDRYREYAVWANNEGIWRTDGSTLTDLAARGEFSTYWQTLVKDFNFGTGWKATGAVVNNDYWITVIDLAGNDTTLVIDLEDYTMRRYSNLKVQMYAPRVSGPGTASEAGSGEMFAAWRSGPRALRLSSIWNPPGTQAGAYDANGMAVLPVVETGYYKLGFIGEKRFRRAYVGYELVDGGDVPRLAVGYVISPDSTSYVESSQLLPARSSFDRQAADIRQKAEGVAFRIRQTAASMDTRLHEIDLEAHPREASR